MTFWGIELHLLASNVTNDLLGDLPQSTSEAAIAIFHRMASCLVDVASLSFDADMGHRVEMAT